jgi:hypothetical protein
MKPNVPSKDNVAGSNTGTEAYPNKGLHKLDLKRWHLIVNAKGGVQKMA